MKLIRINTRLVAHTLLFMLLIPGYVFHFSSSRQLNIFQKDSDEFPFEFDTNYSYRMQHKAIMDNNDFYLCNFESGKDVMSLIDAAEKSAYSENNIWIKNEKNL